MSRPCQAGDDRLARPGDHRVLRRDRGERVAFCDSAPVAGPPRHRRQGYLGELLILGRGRPCPPGTDGTIWFRGATAFEYFEDPGKTAAGRRESGITSTVGDVGHVDAEGYLYLTHGRAT